MANESTSGQVPIQGTHLSYEEAGAGMPVVLIHAGIADSRMWDDQWQAFAARYRVIRYDVRGFGRSGPRAGPFSHVEDLARLLDHLAIEKAVLLGASMGGAIAIDFTLTHPERVRALIAACAGLGGYRSSQSTQTLWRRIGEAFEAGDQAGAIELELQMWVDGPDRAPGAAPHAVRERVRQMEITNLAQDAETVESDALEPPAVGRLSEIQAPTLVLVGAHDVPDMLTIADLLEREIGGAQKAVFAAAHLPNMEQPEEFNRVVLDFLDGLA